MASRSEPKGQGKKGKQRLKGKGSAVREQAKGTGEANGSHGQDEVDAGFGAGLSGLRFSSDAQVTLEMCGSCSESGLRAQFQVAKMALESFPLNRCARSLVAQMP